MLSHPTLPPSLEAERQAAVDDLTIDPLLKTALDELASNAAHRFGTPLAAVTLLDRDRQVFAGGAGFEQPSSPREGALCNWTIMKPGELTVIEDASKDPRLATSAHVHGRAALLRRRAHNGVRRANRRRLVRARLRTQAAG